MIINKKILMRLLIAANECIGKFFEIICNIIFLCII